MWAVAQEVQEGHNRGTQQKEEDQERAPNKERAPHGFVVYVDCLRAQALPTAVCAIILKNKPPRPYRSHVEAAPDIRGRPANSNNATPCEPPTRSPVARHTAANARARRRIASSRPNYSRQRRTAHHNAQNNTTAQTTRDNAELPTTTLRSLIRRKL